MRTQDACDSATGTSLDGTLNGQAVPGGAVPLRGDDREHDVRVASGRGGAHGRLTSGRGRPGPAADRRGPGRLQWTTLLYYLHETNPDNGLVRDKTDPRPRPASPRSGMALATVPVLVERGVLIREFAAKIARKRLRFLRDSPQGPEPDATGYKGFYYHFLDMETGRRAWECELSTIDSAFLLAGMLDGAAYFDRDTADEAEVRRLADALYRRADWDWAATAGRRSRTAGGRRPASSRTAGRATTRRCCSTCSASARRRTRSRRRATPPTAPPTSGRSIYGHELLYSGPALHPPALAPLDRLPRHPRRLHARRTAATTSRTAGGRPLCSRSTRSATRWSSRATGSIAGGSRPATAPAG